MEHNIKKDLRKEILRMDEGISSALGYIEWFTVLSFLIPPPESDS